jgi:hypothetical protein
MFTKQNFSLLAHQQPRQTEIESSASDLESQSAFSEDTYFLKQADYMEGPYRFPLKDGSGYVPLMGLCAPPYEEILILKHEGRCLLADYYQEKYGVNIYVLSKPQKSLPVFIEHLRKQDSVKAGFVCYTGYAGNGHTVPLIYEKNGKSENVIFLDALGPFGLRSFRAYSGDVFNIQDVKILLYTPSGNKINFYAATGIRQVDNFSCANDAFIILKDALREDNLMDLIKCNVEKDDEYSDHGFIPINLPSQWGKAVQSKKFLSKLSLDTDVKCKQPTTLGVFRDRYEKEIEIIPIESDGYGRNLSPVDDECLRIKKSMNIYLKLKGYRNVERVKKHFEKHKHNLGEIYSKHDPASYLSSESSRLVISRDVDSHSGDTMNEHSHQVSAAPR